MLCDWCAVFRWIQHASCRVGGSVCHAYRVLLIGPKSTLSDWKWILVLAFFSQLRLEIRQVSILALRCFFLSTSCSFTRLLKLLLRAEFKCSAVRSSGGRLLRGLALNNIRQLDGRRFCAVRGTFLVPSLQLDGICCWLQPLDLTLETVNLFLFVFLPGW